MVLISTSLITNDVEDPSMCLLAMCMSLLEKCLFKCFALLQIWIFWSFHYCKNCLFNLNTSPLSSIRFANIFAHSEGHLLTFVMVSFETNFSF